MFSLPNGCSTHLTDITYSLTLSTYSLTLSTYSSTLSAYALTLSANSLARVAAQDAATFFEKHLAL